MSKLLHDGPVGILITGGTLDKIHDTATESLKILKAVITAPENRLVITHGTGTMELTAKALDAQVGSKTVVLTGAMRPWSLGRSDRNFNLGGAIIAARLLPAGVYGVMNGRVFSAAELHKNTETGRFD